MSKTDDRTGGNDAVAFTSGPQGAPFSAGVVHAWLAADRRPPLVAAGISMGAVAAAALRRVYQELEYDDTDDLEIKRWRWYQRYYLAVTDNPLGPLWKALPKPVDFYADTPPVKDLADRALPDKLFEDSVRARRHFYLLVKLGLWLAELPIRLSTLATAGVMFIRTTEGYGFPLESWLSLRWNAFLVCFGLLFHLVRSPRWIWESHFRPQLQRKGFRPLFGWKIYLFSLAALLSVTGISVAGFIFSCKAFGMLLPGSLSRFPLAGCLVAASWGVLFCLTVSILLHFARSEKGVHYWIGPFLLTRFSNNLDIAKGLLHPFEIKRTLHALFVQGAPDYILKPPASNAPRALLVCAALEATDQIILSEEMAVVDSVAAAVAIPGILPPQEVDGQWVVGTRAAKIDTASGVAEKPQKFQVIDGAAVRNNPLPAFFDWCRDIASKEVTSALHRQDGKSPSLHVVYSVPIGYDGSVQDAPGMDCPDIVRSAQTARQLEKRRDTRQEVRQANNVSRLAWLRRAALGGNPSTDQESTFTIPVGEIAPRREIDLGNEFVPEKEMLGRTVAEGCKVTLETLYRINIKELIQSRATLSCRDLLYEIAPRRSSAITVSPGLKSVCDFCDGKLCYRPEQDPNRPQEGVSPTFGEPTIPTPERIKVLFPQLTNLGQKVIFLGSGGVFRGSFHIGVLAAMNQVELFPDLVVGASIGTLMGGALCRMTADGAEQAISTLSDLSDLFLHVDKRVSLTATFKNAAKQLGVRARGVRFSPSELRRKVLAGAQKDAGYAATGAPPLLTDAISYLFTIPHLNTTAVTSDFVSGHFSKAISQFLQEVRSETLASFDIRHHMMGTSLLEAETRKLLSYSKTGEELSKPQPYQNTRHPVAFFGTTSYLNASSPLLLGRDFLSPGRGWSTTEAALCSSAFPAVFAARPESSLLPGSGRTDRFFGDGGMFDNLPFFPAIEVLAETQKSASFVDAATLQSRLKERAAQPNLFVAAGLNQQPVPILNYPVPTMFAAMSRANTLSYESKTKTFSTSAEKVTSLLSDISECDLSHLTQAQQESLNHIVSGKVVSITPSDVAHINPTFAFCKTLGLSTKRVQASIANGCFRSLFQFEMNAAVKVRLETSKTPVRFTTPSERTAKTQEALCPYFTVGEKRFVCPFAKSPRKEVKQIYSVCRLDKVHTAGHREKSASIGGNASWIKRVYQTFLRQLPRQTSGKSFAQGSGGR